MRITCGAITGPVAAGLLSGILLAAPAAARDRGRDRHSEDGGWGPSVGRNAPEAITSGLAQQGTGWLDTMANFYADPHIKNGEYFDYYRRPYQGHPPADRRR